MDLNGNIKIIYNQMIDRYKKLCQNDKYLSKTPEWWWDTHGINLEEINE